MTICRLAYATGHDPMAVEAWPASIQNAMAKVLRDVADPEAAMFEEMLAEVEAIQNAG